MFTIVNTYILSYCVCTIRRHYIRERKKGLTPGLPLLLALALLPWTVGELLKFIGKQHTVMSGVFEEVFQTAVLPAHTQKNIIEI